MGQSSLKNNRRALRKTAKEEKNNIVSRYMTENWDKVLTTSVALIRQFNFKNRFQIAMTIIFRPLKKTNEKVPETPKTVKKHKSGLDKAIIPNDTPPSRQPEKSGAAAQG